MSNLSFQEKSAWGSLIANTVIGTLYFSSVWNLWRGDQLSAPILLKLAFGYAVFLVIVLIAYHIVTAAISRPEAEDERDRLIGWRAASAGGLVLGFGVFTIVFNIVVGNLYRDPRNSALIDSPLMIANALLLVMLVATVAELGLKLYYYRRGF